MRDSDLPAFGELLDAVCGLLSRGSYTPNATNTALWFRALREHPIAVVRAAFDAHVKDPQRGRFVPTPADVIAQIEGLAEADGRPGAEEAWAIALRSKDEAETVVWTAEIEQALAIARPVLNAGDDVGARMAFRETYERLVDEARRQRMPAAWSVSLGFDAKLRDRAIAAAVACGRLPQDELLRLPAPEIGGLVSAAPPQVREHLLALAERVRAAPEPESVEAAEHRATAELKAEAARKVAEYERQQAAMRAELRLVEEGEQQAAVFGSQQREGDPA